MDPLDLYPSPSKEALKNLFVGKQLGEVATPAAVLDRAVIERNCSQMLRACQALDLLFRAHVKTTKVISCKPVVHVYSILVSISRLLLPSGPHCVTKAAMCVFRTNDPPDFGSI